MRRQSAWGQRSRGMWGRGRGLGRAAVALVAAFVILSGACTPSAAPRRGETDAAAARITGWLRTDGRHIVDDRSGRLRLLSVNVQGMGSGAGNRKAQGVKGWEVPTQETYENVAAWGFNSVRIPIAWANIEPLPPSIRADGTAVHTYNDEYLEGLDEVVEGFGEQGVAVILCMCQFKWSPAFPTTRPDGTPTEGSGMPAWLYPDGAETPIFKAKRDFFANEGGVWEWFIAAWQEVLARYEDNPTVVGVDMINEPYYGTKWMPTAADLHLDEFYLEVGSGIREVNPNLLLIFEDSQHRSEKPLALRGPPPFPNVVYSFHAYTNTWDPDGLERAEAYLERAREWEVPLWIGEFNRFGNELESKDSPIPMDWEDQLSEMMEYCRDNEIGWAFYGYHGRDALATLRDEVRLPELLEVLRFGF